MVSKSDYQLAIANWNRRAVQAKAAGVADAIWKPLAQKDLNNVMQGHTPMQDAEVHDAVLAALGQTPIHDPKPSTDNPLDILGNVSSDVQGLVTGFIPGIADYVTSLPQQSQDFIKLLQQDPATQQKYGMETSGGVAAFIRDMARTPVFAALIPGLHTAAGLTTDTGRKELEQHPASTLIDVLYGAKEGGSLATKGLEAGAEGSTLEAFQKGRPVRGAVRGTSDLLSHIPGIGSVFDRTRFNQFLMDAGIHPDIVDQISRPKAEIQSAATRSLRDFIKTNVEPYAKGLTLDEHDALYQAAVNPGVNDVNIQALPVEQQAILYNIRSLMSDWQAEREGNGLISVPGPDGKPHVYSEDEAVGQHWKKATRAQTLFDKALDKLDKVQEQRAAREAKVETRMGKLRHFHEHDDAFNARDPHPVTVDSIRQASSRLVEIFRDQDILNDTEYGKGILGSDMPVQALTSVLRDVKTLSGNDGLLAKWDDAMAKGDLKVARQTWTQIKRTFNHSSWDRTPYAESFRSHVLDVQREMVGIQSKMRAAGYSMRTLETSLREEERALARAKTTRTLRDTHMSNFNQALIENPEAKYHPLLAQKLRESLTNAAQVKFARSATDLSAAIKTITESTDFEQLRTALDPGGEEEVNQIIKDVKETWLQLAKEGIDPIYLPNVSPSKADFIARPSVLPDSYYKPGFVRKRIFNTGESVHNVFAAIADYKRQWLSEDATREFIDNHLKPLVESESKMKQELRQRMSGVKIGPFGSLEGEVEKEINAHYVTLDDAKSSKMLKQYFPSVQGDNLLIPKGVDRALAAMSKGDAIPAGGVYDSTLKVWKFSVLTTPRHLSHIALGGLTMGVLREPGILLKLKQASAIVRADSEEFLAKISSNVNDVGGDGVYAYAAGKTIGRMMFEAAGKPVEYLNRLEDHIASTYKVAAMLSGEARGLERDVAIREANKVFVDMNSMTPFERVTLRKVFPFYGFTRHLFRYLFTYPADHPIRAAILSNFSRQMQEDWNSGLPRSFQMLFFLGAPDANGNVTGIDYRSIDPFRSYYNDFTLAGITSQLNPVAQTLLTLGGMNTLSATPELYPGSHFDPYTGSMVADRPSGSQTAQTLLQSIIPETTAIDALLGISDKYRNLRRTNPMAFQRALFTSLGIPFAPNDINVPLEVETTAQKRFKDAQAAITAAIQSGDFSKAKRYDAVPVPSLFQRFFPGRKYVAPAAIESAYQAVVAELQARGQGDVSPHAALPKATRRRTS